MNRLRRRLIRGLACMAPLFVVACSGGGGNGGDVGPLPATTAAFSGPLSGMNKTVTFNASAATLTHLHASEDFGSSFSERTASHQVRIDPNARTVQILRSGTPVATFGDVDFTAATSTFEFAGNFPNISTQENLTILLPGAAASGLDYASYGVWARRVTACLFQCFTTFDGEALSFGVPTPVGAVPRSGTATYTGHMDGYFTNGFTASDLTGDASLTADFARGAVSGGFTNITAVGPISGWSGSVFGPVPSASSFGDIDFTATVSGNTYSGNASGAGMSGPVSGTFYGPGARETGGVFHISGGASKAVGAFAAKR